MTMPSLDCPQRPPRERSTHVFGAWAVSGSWSVSIGASMYAMISAYHQAVWRLLAGQPVPSISTSAGLRTTFQRLRIPHELTRSVNSASEHGRTTRRMCRTTAHQPSCVSSLSLGPSAEVFRHQAQACTSCPSLIVAPRRPFHCRAETSPSPSSPSGSELSRPSVPFVLNNSMDPGNTTSSQQLERTVSAEPHGVPSGRPGKGPTVDPASKTPAPSAPGPTPWLEHEKN